MFERIAIVEGDTTRLALAAIVSGRLLVQPAGEEAILNMGTGVLEFLQGCARSANDIRVERTA